MSRNYTDIDVEKSIATKTAKFPDSFIDGLNILLVVVFFLFLSGILIFDINRDLNSGGQIDFPTLILEMLGAIIFLYVAIRKITEKRMLTFQTNQNKSFNHKFISFMMDKLNYSSLLENNDIIIYQDRSLFIGLYTYIYIPLDNEILFVAIKDQERLPLPSIATYWTLKSDLKRWLNHFDKQKSKA
ncbi:MAG: hypothetical protein JNJ41_19775 [Bacteroidia bacterium]|nr:hypothetical protein [Bacteroidia bacterium]